MKTKKSVLSLAMAIFLILSHLNIGVFAEGDNGEALGLSESETMSARGLAFEGIPQEVELWKRTDIILSSTQTYLNPYKDVEIQAVFTHESGKQMQLYGFWNGDNEWRVRFSPTILGRWDYKVTSSNIADDGLHNIKGYVTATANTGSTGLDKHGFVRISDNNRHFSYDDDTPFFWLGDTQWQAPNYVSTTMCNYPGCLCENQFKHEVKDRLDKGFNVYQTYFDIGENDGGGQLATTDEPSLWTVLHKEIDPSVFTEKIDYMFDHLAENGMTIALGYGVHSHTTNGMDKEDLLLASRYLTARYASYPVVWITAQEINIWEDAYRTWVEVARTVDEMDPYNHPQSAHMINKPYGQNWTEDLDTEDWHQWWAVQGGHHDGALTKSYYQSYWDNTNSTKPFIETELNYEDIICGPFNKYESVRLGAWKAAMNGSSGFTYGVTGIWANNYSTAGNIGWMPSFSYEPWYMGLDKPGSFDVKYMADFFNYIDFGDLTPRFSDTNYSSFNGQEEKSLATTDDGSIYVAHFYNKNLTTGTLYGLNPAETYSANWYNPVTGKFVEIENNIQPSTGEYQIPKKPNKSDWVLLVTSRDFGDYEIEQPYTLPPSTTPENYALGVLATALSDNDGKHRPSSGVDGDYTTAWTASNGVMPQWYHIDMENSVDVQMVDMYLFRGDTGIPATSISFTIEGSQDNISWATIYTGSDEALTDVGGSDFIRVNLVGTCRYLRVVMNGVNAASGTKWATLTELEVYDTTEVDSPINASTQNIAVGKGIDHSSVSSPDNGVEKATDGNMGSYWCAGNGNFPQWIKLDLGEARDFQTARLHMYGGSAKISYELKGSDDNLSWTTITSGTDVTMGSMGNNSYLEFSAVGNYRYLQLVFNNVEGNWATVVEFELFDATFAPPPDDVIPTYSGIVQTPVFKSINTGIYDAEGNYSDTGANLFDGDKDTLWKPFAPIGSQTILMDLLEPNQLNGINITLGENAVIPSFRIDGSNNNSDWTVLLDSNLQDMNLLKNSGRTIISEALSGEYRYIKLLWLNGGSNGVEKTIGEIELYADNGTPAHPSKPNVSQLLSLYLDWKNANNSYGIQPPAKWSALQQAIDKALAILIDLEAATQTEVDNATYEILLAISDLDSVDKSSLQSIILQAEGLAEYNYTAESWSKLQEKLRTAEKVFSAPKTNQSTVDFAASGLSSAIEALVMNGDEPTVSLNHVELAVGKSLNIYVYLGKDGKAADSADVISLDAAVADTNISALVNSGNIVITGLSTGNATITVRWNGGSKDGETTCIYVTVYETKDKVEVVFMDGENICAKRTTNSEGKVEKWPTDPKKENYNFDGWFLDLENIETEYTRETLIMHTIVLYAKWTAVDNPTNPTNPTNPNVSVVQGGARKSSGGSSVRDISVYGAAKSNNAARVAIDKASALAALSKAVADSEGRVSNKITVKFQNPGILQLAVAQELKTDSDKTVIVQGDNISLDGKRVDVRLSLNPSKNDRDISLSASISSREAKMISDKLDALFTNKVQPVVFEHKEAFGQPIEVAVKLDAKLLGKENFFYAYNSDINTYKTIESDYRVDGNGYVHFSIIEGGIVLLSGEALI